MSKHFLAVPLTIFSSAFLFTASAFGSTTFFTGPQLPDGTTCVMSAPGCIQGNPAQYGIFSASLTTPTGGNPDFELTIQTNYPIAIPNGSDIPPSLWNDGLLYSISDFLIQWDGNDYGVVLESHVKGGVAVDGYTAGDLYESPSGFQTSGDVLPSAVRPSVDVWIAPGGTLLSTSPGTVNVATTGDGVATGMYTITVDFSAPAGFLATGVFSIEASSYVCANGLLIGSGSQDPGVPEPGTLFLIAPALGLLLFSRRVREFRPGNKLKPIA